MDTGTCATYVPQTKALIKKALIAENINPDMVDPRSIQQFAIQIAGLSSGQIEEVEFSRLLQEDRRVANAWRKLTEVFK